LWRRADPEPLHPDSVAEAEPYARPAGLVNVRSGPKSRQKVPSPARSLRPDDRKVGAVARTLGCALWGLETALVTVEVDVANGLPHFAIVGLPDTAVQEARERVRAAIRNAGFEFPLRRVTVNLAPAERRKEGTGFDLPIALAILRATGQLTVDPDGLCLGELALDGALRPVRGAMARVRRAPATGIPRADMPATRASMGLRAAQRAPTTQEDAG
jgi:hypothetical protein